MAKFIPPENPIFYALVRKRYQDNSPYGVVPVWKETPVLAWFGERHGYIGPKGKDIILKRYDSLEAGEEHAREINRSWAHMSLAVRDHEDKMKAAIAARQRMTNMLISGETTPHAVPAEPDPADTGK